MTTLEGLPAWYARQHKLAQAPALTPVQQAFIDEQAIQCGYCYNGMTIKACELLIEDSAAERSANPFCHERPSVPVWHLSAHHQSDSAGGPDSSGGRA